MLDTKSLQSSFQFVFMKTSQKAIKSIQGLMILILLFFFSSVIANILLKLILQVCYCNCSTIVLVISTTYGMVSSKINLTPLYEPKLNKL